MAYNQRLKVNASKLKKKNQVEDSNAFLTNNTPKYEIVVNFQILE